MTEETFEGMGFDELFAEIRSVVHGRAAEEAFRRLTFALDALDEDGRERLGPGYLGPVRRWAPGLRQLPYHWMLRALDGEGVPFMDLCAHLILNTEREVDLLDTEYARDVRALTISCFGAGAPLVHRLRGDVPMRLERVSALRLRQLDPTVLQALWRAACFDELRELRLDPNPGPMLDFDPAMMQFGDAWRDTIKWAAGKASLKVLRLDGDCDVGDLIEDLGGATARLEELHFDSGRSMQITDEQLFELLALPALSTLEHLSLDYQSKRFTGRLRDSAIEILANAPCAETLAHVSLKQHNLTESGVAGLQNLPKLVRLDVSGNDFDPEALTAPHEREAPAEVVHEECMPEAQRSHLDASTRHSVFQRVRWWREHIDGDMVWVYGIVVGLVAVMHSVFIAFMPQHPLPWSVPLVVAPPLLTVRMLSWLPITQIMDWADLDEGAHPRHEVREVNWRAARACSSLLVMYAGLFALAAWLCVWQGFAAEQTAWLEAVWWTLGPFIAIVVFLVGIFLLDYVTNWSAAVAPDPQNYAPVPSEAELVGLVDDPHPPPRE